MELNCAFVIFVAAFAVIDATIHSETVRRCTEGTIVLQSRNSMSEFNLNRLDSQKCFYINCRWRIEAASMSYKISMSFHDIQASNMSNALRVYEHDHYTDSNTPLTVDPQLPVIVESTKKQVVVEYRAIIDFRDIPADMRIFHFSFVSKMHGLYALENMVRLTHGYSIYQGRLEIYHHGTWGSVCDDNFGNNDATVVCRQLGFSGGIPSQKTVNHDNYPVSRIWMDEVSCTGREQALHLCAFNGWGSHDCSHSEDVHVTCQSPTSVNEEYEAMKYKSCSSNEVEIVSTSVLQYIDLHTNFTSSSICKWLIMSDDPCMSVIRLAIHKSSLLVSSDFLRVYDGKTTYDKLLVAQKISDAKVPVISSGPNILVVFTRGERKVPEGIFLSYENIPARPLISSDSKNVIKGNKVNISVDVSSITRPMSVTWYSPNGKPLSSGDNTHVEMQNIEVPIKIGNSSFSVEGYRVSLSLTTALKNVFGQYKVAVSNDKGIAERIIELTEPVTMPGFLGYSVDNSNVNASISVEFSQGSHYVGCKWYRFSEPDVLLSGGKYTSLVSQKSDNTMVATLHVLAEEEDDYTYYELSVTSLAGNMDRIVHLPLSTKWIPRFLEEDNISVTEQIATLQVTYVQNTGFSTFKWYKGNMFLEDASKYNITASMKDVGVVIASLIISKLALNDFATYRLLVTNPAGTGEHYIDLKEPNVFPFNKYSTQFKPINATCIVTSCTPNFLDWIHTVDNIIVRRLKGHVVGHTNTLQIPRSEYFDAGKYTCVISTEDEGDAVQEMGAVKFHISTTPIVTETNVHIDSVERISIVVTFISYPEYSNINCMKDDVTLNDDKIQIRTLKTKVSATIFGEKIETDGYKSTFEVSDYDDEDFGVYKITIGNDVGTTDRYVRVSNPLDGIPVVSSDVYTGIDENSALLQIVFFAFPKYHSVNWYKNGVSLRDGNKYHVSVEKKPLNMDIVLAFPPHHRTSHVFVTSINITNLEDSDFGTYKLAIVNKKGYQDILIALQNPAAPVFVGDIQVRQSEDMIHLSAVFISNPVYRNVTWVTNNTVLSEGVRYKITTEQLSGNTLIDAGDDTGNRYRTTISIIASTVDHQNDLGVYKVAVRNSAGSTEKSVEVTEDCVTESTTQNSG